MANQRIFKTLYTQKLLESLSDNSNIEKYRQPVFDYDEDAVLIMPGIEDVQEQGLPERIKPRDDFESAKEVFLSLKKLSPIQASDPRLWTYLSHVYLYEYMTQRWHDVITGETSKSDYIIEHWFVKTPSQQCLMRNAISGLWWAAYLSFDETRTDPFELTKVFYKDLDLPTRTIGTYRIGRHKEAVKGILQFIKDFPDVMYSHYETKTRYILKHFNVIGGSKTLSLFDMDFFYNECKEMITEIERL